MRRFDVLTFDCYGTLIDWERGLGDAFASAARGAGIVLDRAAVVAAYHEIEPVIEAERYRSYRDVLALTARGVAERLHGKLSPGDERFVADSLPSWPPFADTNGALRRLADAGHRLAILSNVDDDLLAGTRRHLDVDFEFVVSSRNCVASICACTSGVLSPNGLTAPELRRPRMPCGPPSCTKPPFGLLRVSLRL